MRRHTQLLAQKRPSVAGTVSGDKDAGEHLRSGAATVASQPTAAANPWSVGGAPSSASTSGRGRGGGGGGDAVHANVLEVDGGTVAAVPPKQAGRQPAVPVAGSATPSSRRRYGAYNADYNSSVGSSSSDDEDATRQEGASANDVLIVSEAEDGNDSGNGSEGITG